jgi:hypothetical protein
MLRIQNKWSEFTTRKQICATRGIEEGENEQQEKRRKENIRTGIRWKGRWCHRRIRRGEAM